MNTWARVGAAALIVGHYLASTVWATSPAWPAVTPAELNMTSEPKAPGAPAIFLYRQVDRNDNAATEDHYERIKVLTAAGVGRGTVTILAPKGIWIDDIQARTLHPDGTIVEFDGKQIFHAPAGAQQDMLLSSTTFTLPAVEVGSIIEYHYRINHSEMWVYDSEWLLSEDLFTRYARFSLARESGMFMRMSIPRGLPPGTEPPKELAHHILALEAHDIPAFVQENYSPPKDELRYRIEFVYSSASADKDPASFWNDYARRLYVLVDNFTYFKGPLNQALAQTVASTDSQETKLRKIYARVQQIRVVPHGDRYSEDEKREATAHPIRHAGDVWEQGRGTYVQINWLFLGLVRAAGMQADLVQTALRDQRFFEPQLMNPAGMQAPIVVVHLDGKDLYFSPATRHAPFGLLPWMETAVRGLRITREGGDWVALPISKPSDNQIQRQVNLQFSTAGVLEGKVTVRYTGMEALWRRNRERDEEDPARRKFLEDDVASSVPIGCTITLTNRPDWEGPETPLEAEFNISMPGWAQLMAPRTLFPTGLFSSTERHMFTQSTRTNPLYFWYPYTTHDEIVVQFPDGWQVEGTPKPANVDRKAFKYESSVSGSSNSLHMTRDFTLNALLLPSDNYSGVKAFFDAVRTADEDQAIISVR